MKTYQFYTTKDRECNCANYKINMSPISLFHESNFATFKKKSALIKIRTPSRLPPE